MWEKRNLVGVALFAALHLPLAGACALVVWMERNDTVRPFKYAVQLLAMLLVVAFINGRRTGKSAYPQVLLNATLLIVLCAAVSGLARLVFAP